MTSNSVGGLMLNVWDNEDRGWQMAIYPDTAIGVDTKQYLLIKPTEDQIQRYLQISQDDDWWVRHNHPDFRFILWGDQ